MQRVEGFVALPVGIQLCNIVEVIACIFLPVYLQAQLRRKMLEAPSPPSHDAMLRLLDRDEHQIRSMIRLLDDMLVTMRDAPGVGLAANQIGVPLQVAVIEVDDTITELVNPQVVRTAGDQLDWEGCLSIPEFYDLVVRPAEVRVRFMDIEGEEQSMECSGLLATCIQHEIDHLDGVLFLDRLDDQTRKEAMRAIRQQSWFDGGVPTIKQSPHPLFGV